MLIYYLFIYNFIFSPQIEDEKYSIYVGKNSWHVGIILKVDEDLQYKLGAINHFEKFDYVDIGWGDAEFYQSPSDFDLFLAAKAVLLPTPSVIRIQGYNTSLNEIIKWRDYVIVLKLDSTQYNNLCLFISDSFDRDTTNHLIQTSEKVNGLVKYYSSIHKYYFAYTCNTWVAEALEYSGMEKISTDIITAEELFSELLKFGTLLKIE